MRHPFSASPGHVGPAATAGRSTVHARRRQRLAGRVSCACRLQVTISGCSQCSGYLNHKRHCCIHTLHGTNQGGGALPSQAHGVCVSNDDPTCVDSTCQNPSLLIVSTSRTPGTRWAPCRWMAPCPTSPPCESCTMWWTRCVPWYPHRMRVPTSTSPTGRPLSWVLRARSWIFATSE